MGRSKKSSCLKLISCDHGDELVDEDDPDPISSAENKVSSEKRRWSFRKRSAGHQLPTSTVISETVCDNYNKENIEISASDFDYPISSSVPEKSLINERANEIPEVSSVLVESELNAQLVPCRNSNASDHAIKESEVVIIQAFIRGYMVRREVPKLQNVIKLQAAVRGHLVRRHAVGTLRCAQAIIKMQALIRARRARLVSKKLDEQEDDKYHMDIPNLEKRKSCLEPDKRYSSTKSLLSNGFARQLLESTRNTKPIYISCDPSKSNSAWKWLERWMGATPCEVSQPEKNFQGLHKQEENTKPSNIESGNDNTYAELFISPDSKLAPCEFTLSVEDGMHLETKNSCDFKKDCEDLSQLENDTTGLKQENDSEVKVQIENSMSQLSQIPIQTSDEPECGSNLEKHDPILIAASESGTEISISSTLDSPDRSEAENSVDTKKNKRETGKADGNPISEISKRSPRSSMEHLQKEPRISTSDSLPSYMQATESAKAKAHSPRSSPDFVSKDNNLKKMYSPPIANGKQGLSSHMQRSPSQAHHNSKGNDNHSPHNSAERRWQR